MGTPTGAAQSGTIEEIEQFRKAAKHAALYFSTADVPRNADRDQLKALEDYQRERQKDTLYATFRTGEELLRLVTQHLPKIVSEVRQSIPAGADAAKQIPSLVFVFGVPLGDNYSASWLMLLRHYGPKPTYNCNVEFYDSDRKNIEHQWLVAHPIVIQHFHHSDWLQANRKGTFMSPKPAQKDHREGFPGILLTQIVSTTPYQSAVGTVYLWRRGK